MLAAINARQRGDHADLPDLAAMFSSLPPQYRQALTLFYLEEKSYEEVAAMLAIPIGTVRTYLHRGRKQLAESFAKEKVRCALSLKI